MPACYLAGCGSGSGGRKTHLFKVKEEWLNNLPKRADRDIHGRPIYICHLHFEESLIIKENVVCFNGEVIAREQRKQWALSPGAIPTKFPNDQDQVCTKRSKRNVPKREHSNIPRKRGRSRTEIVDPYLDDEHSGPTAWEISLIGQIREYVSGNKLQIPTINGQWMSSVHIGIDPNNNRTPILRLYEMEENDEENPSVVYVRRSLQVLQDLSMHTTIRGQKGASYTISSVYQLQDEVTKFVNYKLCTGIHNYEIVKSCENGYKWLNVWYSNLCSGICEFGACTECLSLQNALKVAKYYASQVHNPVFALHNV